MKQQLKPIIRLIPSDFIKGVNTPCVVQYTFGSGCPIFKACRRLGIKVDYVSADKINFWDGSYVNIGGSYVRVEEARKNLLEGKPGIIEMYP